MIALSNDEDGKRYDAQDHKLFIKLPDQSMKPTVVTLMFQLMQNCKGTMK